MIIVVRILVVVNIYHKLAVSKEYRVIITIIIIIMAIVIIIVKIVLIM